MTEKGCHPPLLRASGPFSRSEARARPRTQRPPSDSGSHTILAYSQVHLHASCILTTGNTVSSVSNELVAVNAVAVAWMGRRTAGCGPTPRTEDLTQEG